MGLPFPHIEHIGVVINSLAREYIPVIKARWRILGIVARKVPLANQSRLITGFLEELWKRGLRSVKTEQVAAKAIFVAVFPRKDGRPAWAADRVDRQALSQAHAFMG